MKKFSILCIICTLILSMLCGCGSAQECIVTFKDGTTENISAAELTDICSNDAVSWEKYVGAEISGSGKITKIEEGSQGFHSITTATVIDSVKYYYEYYQVYIDDDIIVLTRAEKFEGFAVGDEVTFDGAINPSSDFAQICVDYGDDPMDSPKQHIFHK